MKDLTQADKKAIKFNLVAHLTVTKQSGNAFSAKAGVSGANISKLLNNKWESIGDNIFRKVAAASGYSFEQWISAKTSNLLMIDSICEFSQSNSATSAFCYHAGTGKTHGFKEYANTHKEVIYIEVDYNWTRKMFFQMLADKLGIDTTGQTASFLAELIIRKLLSYSKPLLIIDEADKMTESGMMFFITLYNRLDGRCGIVLSGAPYFAKYIEKCAKRDKRGYKEIYSRLGKRFISLEPISLNDVRKVAQANGVIGESEIQEMYNDADGDLRRVKRDILKIKAKNQLKIA